ncbi:hypothetical protein OSTOST_21543, partial [Ostertagia ostertagi]
VLGGIANLHTQIPPTKSKLQAELRTFAQFISVLAICMAVAMFLIGCIVAKFENVLDHFVMGFLVVIVANIPQGLPATVMSQLRIIARRMAQKNIYIKKLDLIGWLRRFDMSFRVMVRALYLQTILRSHSDYKHSII